ncbi:hypothetical protein ACFGVR_21620 [Mucilaginibacter sp. AW1-3]
MKLLLLLGIGCFFLCSCNKYNTIYFDLKDRAIVSCSDTIKEIDIETPQSTIKILGHGYRKPFYINRLNPDYTISIDGELQSGYIITLQPNTTYIVKSQNGFDQGPSALDFSTDDKGRVVSASKTWCN